MKWAEFEAAAPELAALGLAGFREQNLCLIGTLRADGWPRISANEVYLLDGNLLLQMMRGSRKAADLERDPRLDAFPLYAVDIESAAYIDFTDDRRLMRWTPDGGLERLIHPDDADTERGTWE